MQLRLSVAFEIHDKLEINKSKSRRAAMNFMPIRSAGPIGTGCL